MQCVATIERHARAAVSAVTVYTREPKDACLRSAYSRSRKLLIEETLSRLGDRVESLFWDMRFAGVLLVLA